MESTKENMFSFKTRNTQNFQYHLKEHRLFSLPIFKNKILKLKNEKIWQDLFSLDVEVAPQEIKAMIYNLFILHLRTQIFPKQTQFFSYLPEQKWV